MDELRLVAINGMLGYGYSRDSLAAGVAAQPHMLGGDAGSTDAGPHPLGSGVPLTKEMQVYRDLRHALIGARQAKVPLVIGSAGIAGGEPHLQIVIKILRRIAREEDLHFRAAFIHAEIEKSAVHAALKSGVIEPMRGVPALTPEAIDRSVRIVGQMGTEPFVAALEAGAEVIIAGRSCDTAIFAAMPIMEGYDPGLALHMAKIMECGAQCAIPLAPNDSLLGVLRRDHFLIRPLNPNRICTPESVAAHSLYEQPDPFLLFEPEGMVDLSQADFEQVDRQTVRVSGSRFFRKEGRTTIKLEGARSVGFRTFTIGGVRDRTVIANLDVIESEVRRMVAANLSDNIDPDGYQLLFRVYGRNAVLGSVDPDRASSGHEVGILIEAVAPDQTQANEVLSLARSSFIHCPFPGRKTTAGNFAFPFSPSDYAGGEVFEFSVYHLMEVDDARQPFPIDFEQI